MVRGARGQSGRPSEEPVAKTIFAAVEADPALLAKVERAPALGQARRLLAAGIVRLIALVSDRIAAGDRSQPWRELRAALLDQVVLDAVAG